MNFEDTHDYERRAYEELDLAAAATDRAVKIRHLNQAARYATLSERAAEPECGEAKQGAV